MTFAKGLGMSLAVSLLASTAIAEIKVGFIGSLSHLTLDCQRSGAQKWLLKS